MKKRAILAALAVSLMLTGCGWMDGSYLSVVPHREQRQSVQLEAMSAENYQDLIAAMEELVSAGRESATITVADYPETSVDGGMAVAIRYAKETYPLGAYAVEDITYELGTSGGLPAVAVTVTYRRSTAELQRIRRLKDMNEAEQVIAEALQRCDAGAVMLVEKYSARDLTQLVQDYAGTHPRTVMETPQVTEAIYGKGGGRVVELIFTYQNSRDDLRQMKAQVEPVFNSAALYVSGDGAQQQKYAQLFAFLMERFDYKIETSITPAYSLLRHGVGDSRAFAAVYAAMCREAGLECQTVTGTYAGEPRTWNMVLDDGYYYHVDLLRCSELGSYREFTDAQMGSYVWDYSAYPECLGAPEPAEPVQKEQGPQEETEADTQPQETAPEPAGTEETIPETTEMTDSTETTEAEEKIEEI